MKARYVGKAQKDYNMLLAGTRIIAFAAIELHEEFDFGRKRLLQFILGINDQSKQFSDFQSDDVGDEMLCKILRQMKLAEMADEIEDLKK